MSVLKFNILKNDFNSVRPMNQKAKEWVECRESKEEAVYLKEVKPSELRTLSQNRLMWKWYAEIGAHVGMEPKEVHAQMKLEYGVPILIRDSEKFAITWEPISMLDYTRQIAIIEHIDITKTFTKKQGAEFMEAVQRYGAKAGAVLTDPSARFYE